MSKLKSVYYGGCHCGSVTFEVRVSDTNKVPEIQRCNCSICNMTGFIHWIVPKSTFRLTSGEQQLSLYQFNTKVARHYFCQNCGIKSFYVPRSNPDGVSINVNCLTSTDWHDWSISSFDGENWERSAGDLAHLSKEP